MEAETGELSVPGRTMLPDLIRVDGPARGWWTRAGLVSAAVVFLALGVVGWLLPVVTGIPFYVLGLLTLGMASRRMARRINSWERRLPQRLRVRLRPKRFRQGLGDARE